MTAAAGYQSGSITCQATYFSGRKLHGEWRIVHAGFRGPDFSYLEEPKWESSNPLIKVSFVVEEGDTVTFQLTYIELDGPNCDKWREAFR